MTAEFVRAETGWRSISLYTGRRVAEMRAAATAGELPVDNRSRPTVTHDDLDQWSSAAPACRQRGRGWCAVTTTTTATATATATATRTTAPRTRTKQQQPEPVTVQGLCETCYSVHPVRLEDRRRIDYVMQAGLLSGACPVCQVADRHHVLIRDASDPRRDQVEREAEEERIAQDAEITWHLTELQRLGVTVRRDDYPEAARIVRWLDDGEFVLTLAAGWAEANHARRLEILGYVRQRAEEPDEIHQWQLFIADDNGPASAGIAYPVERP